MSEVDGFKIGTAAASLEASYEFYFGKRYRKVKKGEPMFEMIEANKHAGLWVCDAYDHNDPKGCPNPKCFAGQMIKIFDVLAERGNQ